MVFQALEFFSRKTGGNESGQSSKIGLGERNLTYATFLRLRKGDT